MARLTQDADHMSHVYVHGGAPKASARHAASMSEAGSGDWSTVFSPLQVALVLRQSSGPLHDATCLQPLPSAATASRADGAEKKPSCDALHDRADDARRATTYHLRGMYRSTFLPAVCGDAREPQVPPHRTRTRRLKGARYKAEHRLTFSILRKQR